MRTDADRISWVLDMLERAVEIHREGPIVITKEDIFPACDSTIVRDHRAAPEIRSAVTKGYLIATMRSCLWALLGEDRPEEEKP